MPAYIPPHRRQGSSSDAALLPSPHRPLMNMHVTTNLPPRWQGERPSRPSSSHRDVAPRGLLLQAHGDSFVGPLTQLTDKLVDVHRYSGATAKGLGNENSYKRVGPRLIACLDKTRPEKVLLQFGNVDINISSVYRLETKGNAGWDEKQFVADVWSSYRAFLENHVLGRLVALPDSPSSPSPSERPGFIRDLYLCKTTLPVVSDEALPESHAKYQYRESKKNMDTEPSTEDERELELQRTKRIQRVRPLIAQCGLGARRRMTADFNARLEAFVAESCNSFPPEAPARLHLVDLNQHIRKEPGSDEVAAQYVTDDPTNLHVTWENTLLFWVQELASCGLHTSHMPAKHELNEQWARYAARKEEQMEIRGQKRKDREESQHMDEVGI